MSTTIIRKPNSNKFLAAATVCMAAILICGPCVAAAQDATGQQSSSNSAGTLQEVLVTAQRRSQSNENVPISVEAFSADQLAATGVSNITDLATVTPGLVMGSQGGYVQPRLRGVGTLAVSPGVENPIAIYVDGVYYSAMPGSLLTLSNIASV